MTHNTRSSKTTDDWETPIDLFNALNDVFQFDIDIAASVENAKCVNFCSLKVNNFFELHNIHFSDRRIFCNPPFSFKDEFLSKIISLFRTDYPPMSATVLVPNNARETSWWNTHALQAEQIINILPRVNYCLNGSPVSGVPFSTCALVYRRKFSEDSCVYGTPQEIYWRYK